MKNKVEFKKYLKITLFISIILWFLYSFLHMYEYHIYTKNLNNKLVSITALIHEKYPNISNDDLIEVFNQTDKYSDIFKQYGIDIQKDPILLENRQDYFLLFIFNSCFFFITITILIVLFFLYNRKKDKKINEITSYIEAINRGDYSLHIDDISEDELSILKNEIYKTTIMLKENATHSIEDKKKLKCSLEDISHQLKTPLTSIFVMLDNLIDEPNMEKLIREDFLRDIKREMTNIHFLVQAILKLSMFDSNTILFIKKEVFLEDIVKEAIKNIESMCDLKNISINITSNTHPKIIGDFKWQVEAITNILKNCIEHSKNDSEILIFYTSNDVYASIQIEDFGGGIDKEDLPHIFERFYKGKNHTPNSIGIGLSLAKSIIEEDNGRIHVDTKASGTIFTIKYFHL